MIRFGRCECCSVLKEEVSFLRSLVAPKPETKQDELPRVTFEADGVLSGQDHQTDFESIITTGTRQAEIDSEAARILSANY